LSLTVIDKIFWLRAALGVVAGTLAELLTGCKVMTPVPKTGAVCVGGLTPDYTTGILVAVFVYLATFYALKWTVGKKGDKEFERKLYTTGVGSYALLFIFSWVLLYTLGVTYLNL
jgi:hypothetical protein